jgi:phosphatidylserine/phosphatidylglycerophosphate/cardiolipin synthase-like enzyme
MGVESFKLRRIFKSSATGPEVIRELLQLMFLSELLSPSERIWIVSPWISDVPVLDNRSGNFDVMNPEWHRREIRLSDLAVQVLSGGSQLVIVTRPDEHNLGFLDQFTERANELALMDNVIIEKRESLHTKGILTDNGLLLGSMNLTYSGFELNDEVIEYDISSQRVAEARHSFLSYLSEGTHGDE